MLILAALLTAQDSVLAAAIEAVRPYEVPGRPCLARDRLWPQVAPADRRRQREVRSDSHWLNRLVRERYGHRLAYSGLDASGGHLRHVVWLTGTAPIPALRLTHRAADVPVLIKYGAPWTEEEVLRRRRAAGPERARLVPDAQGEGFMQGPDAGAITLDVYSPDGRPRADVLAHCEDLRRAYRLPVLISFIAARASH